MGDRLLLTVIDDSPESALALRFAARRASHFDGRVAMLKVIPPIQFDHWVGVAERAAEEAREEAKRLMDKYAEQVQACGGQEPVYMVREGLIADELVAQILEGAKHLSARPRRRARAQPWAAGQLHRGQAGYPSQSADHGDSWQSNG